MSGDWASAPGLPRYRLRLYIAGSSPRSRRTIANLRRICSEHLGEVADVEIVDIYQQPDLAKADRIVAAPTLLRLSPLPLRQIIGDLSDEPRVLRGLGLTPADELGDEHGN